MNRTTVPGLAGAQSAAALNGLKGLIDNLQTAGVIRHGALVDAKYVAERGVTTGVQYSGEAMFVQPTTLAEALVVLPLLKTAWNNHCADGKHAHLAADVTNVVTSPTPTDQTTAETIANELKTDLGEHISEAGTYHPGRLPVGVWPIPSKASATDLNSLLLLTGDIQIALKHHLFSAAPALVLQNA